MSRAQLIAGMPFALAIARFTSAKLRRAQPHPYALVSTLPKILWSDSWSQGLTEMVLAYGYPHTVSRPLIEVATCFAEQDCSFPSLEQAIARAEHRDACFARSEWVDAGGPFDPFPAVSVPARQLGRDERTVTVDGEERTVTVLSYGDYAALRFQQGSADVMAVSRFGSPDSLSFQAIDDLEPYFAGYKHFVLSWLNPWAS
jgi:hypothetical protein